MHQDSNSKYDQALDQASEWIVKLRSPDANKQDKIEFSRWLNADAVNPQAFDEVMDLWEAMGDVKEEAFATPAPTASRFKNVFRFNPFGVFTGAAVFAGMIVAVALIVLAPKEHVEFMEYDLKPGEDALILLDDGTNVHLNTRTHVRITYTDALRLVELIKGEAYFEVASNKKRPFIVDTGRGTVTAIGTAFNINRGSREDTVSVTEGMVRVKQKKDATTPFPESKFVNENYRTTLSSNGLTEAAKIDQTKTVEWLSQTITYKNSPISKVLDELNRYLIEPVTYSAGSLNHLKVSGTFSTEVPEDTLQVLIASFDLSLSGNRQISAHKTSKNQEKENQATNA